MVACGFASSVARYHFFLSQKMNYKKIYLGLSFYFLVNILISQTPTFLFSPSATPPDSVLSCPLRVVGFQQMATFQTSIAWDSAAMQLVSIGGFNLTDLDASNFGYADTASGRLTVVWYDGAAVGKSLADSTAICQLKFRLKMNCNTQTTLNFANFPTTQLAARFQNGVPQPITASFLGNNMTATCAISLTNAVLKNPKCYNESSGNIDISMSGGLMPYKFLWSNGAMTEDLTGAAAGSYQLTVTDAQGTQLVSTNFLLTNPSRISDSLLVTNIKCFDDKNGSIFLTLQGGTPPYAVMWSGANNFQSADQDLYQLNGGTYLLVAQDSKGCLLIKNVVVGEPAPLTLQLQTTPLGSNRFRMTAQPNGGTLPYQIKWITGSTQLVLSNVAAGNYSATVTDANGCKASQTLQTTASFEAWKNIEMFDIFPNPADDRCAIRAIFWQPTILFFAVYDGVGQLFFYKKYDVPTDTCNETIETTSLPNGCYFVKIADDSGNFTYKKLLVVH